MTHWIATGGNLAIIDLPDEWSKKIGTEDEDGDYVEEYMVIGQYLESLDECWEGINLDGDCEWGGLIDATLYIPKDSEKIIFEKPKKKKKLKIVD